MTADFVSYLCQIGWTLATLVNRICIKYDKEINSEGPAPDTCGKLAFLTDLNVACNDQSTPVVLYV